MNENQIKEYQKCKDDIKYFIEQYCKLPSHDDGLINIKLDEQQQIILNSICAKQLTVYEKLRQIGATSLLACYSIHSAIFDSPNRTIGMFSINVNMRTNMKQRIKLIIYNLPDFLRPNIICANQHYIKFGNNTVIKFLPLTNSEIKGINYDVLIFDECAFDKNFNKEFVYDIMPIVSKTNKTIFVSEETSKPSYWDKFVKNYLLGKYG